MITQALGNKYGKISIDTNSWKNEKIRMFLRCVKLATRCNHIILLPAHNGVKVLIPLFVILAKLMRCKTHYIVVGAWLGNILKTNKLVLTFIKKINFIYVQTKTLKHKLEKEFLLSNILIMPNFKNLAIVSKESLNILKVNPEKVCIISRIEPQKGIEDDISVVRNVNKGKNNKISLDIYGPIKHNYRSRFKSIVEESSYVEYKGVLDYNKTVQAIKSYYLLLFPTKYYTEGIPGTVIDAYASGVSVLCSRWESCNDVLNG